MLFFKIDIKDLDNVSGILVKEGFDVSSWLCLGLELGLYHQTLKAIDIKNGRDPMNCLLDCLAAWLKGQDKVKEKGGANWTTLARALDKIGECCIAKCLSEKYLH